MSLNAQAPEAVPAAKEPHHHLVLENSYVRVLRVSVPPNGATLLHQHDVPYLYVSLGPADIVNAVAGKPEVHMTMTDGQIGYSKGGFAHIARTDSGLVFNNVTVELLKPQGAVKNLCDQVVDGPPLKCTGEVTGAPADSLLRGIMNLGANPRRSFETDEIAVASYSFVLAGDYREEAKNSRLLIAEDGAKVQVAVSGESNKSLGSGETAWFDAGKQWKIILPRQNKPTRFLMIRFKDTDAAAKR